MNTEPSPRPWRAKRSPIGSNTWIVSGETFVASVSSASGAALIVAAVNERAKFEAAHMEFPDLRPVLIAAGQRDAAIAERDRLRDIIKRLITVREKVFWRKDEKTGLMYETCLMDEDEARKTIEEAKAAIKEDKE